MVSASDLHAEMVSSTFPEEDGRHPRFKQQEEAAPKPQLLTPVSTEREKGVTGMGPDS